MVKKILKSFDQASFMMKVLVFEVFLLVVIYNFCGFKYVLLGLW